MFKFHSVCGSRVKLSNGNRTAERLKANIDFNNGVVFSDKKLKTGIIFQVRIDKKVGLWSGGIEFGVTTSHPDRFVHEKVPASASELRNGTWIMASKTILQNGETLIENYGYDLENLDDNDTVGLTRTHQGELVFFVNGISQGLAVSYIPENVFVILNLYGKCSQVTIVDVPASEQSSNTVQHLVSEEISSSSYSSSEANIAENNKLKFHRNCGPLVKLSTNFRTAERRRPMEEFNNAVVLTDRPLRNNELFQVRIDLLVHKWSGSIEFGLTTHNPEVFEFPATMTIMRDGTVIMSGNGILHDGKATNSPYTNFNLDQLQEGDRIGVMKRSNGDVHYFVNGVDIGVATTGMLQQVWGAINLYGMAAKVTIVDRNLREEHNLRVNANKNHFNLSPREYALETEEDLLFHPNCGYHAEVINCGRTAHRPNACEDFNHGVVLTNRMVKANELFEVRLDKIVTKWAGSIEIGVTTHVPTKLDYPCTMTNVRTGTWMMTGNGIMHNGTSILDEYGISLDKLKVEDRVGVLRKENGDLHFYVNGQDQGCAATNVPANVFGVIDLYGQAAQATIVYQNGSRNECIDDTRKSIRRYKYNQCHLSSKSNLRFHHLHGRNARISEEGFVATRPNALCEFNAAIVMSNRSLRDNELFEVMIEQMVDRWSGNIEAGVTTIRPEDMVFPNTMTDLDHDTIMLSGSSIMQGGNTVTNKFNCNLDDLTVGSRVGVMRKSDATLHYFIDGVDVGIAAYDVAENVYAVFDLYGQVSRISISRFGESMLLSNQMMAIMDSMSGFAVSNESSHKFNSICGSKIMLQNSNCFATRVSGFDNGLVFSAAPLECDEPFEIRIMEVNERWAGSLSIGVTSFQPSLEDNDDDGENSNIPSEIKEIISPCWYISGSKFYKNGAIVRDNYCIHLSLLCPGDRVGICITADMSLRLLVNGQEMDVAAYCLPHKLYAVVDLYGSTGSVLVTSCSKANLTPTPVEPTTVKNADNFSSPVEFRFHEKHGQNIELCNGNLRAKRVEGYGNGILVSEQTVVKDQMFQIKIEKTNPKWVASIMVGVVECNPTKMSFPLTVFSLKDPFWLIANDSLYRNRKKIKLYGPNLDKTKEGDTIGLLVDSNGNLHLYFNFVDCGVAVTGVTTNARYLVDLYGQCEQISIWDGSSCSKDVQRDCNLSVSLNDEGNDMAKSHCIYLGLCKRIKDFLYLPDNYFEECNDPIICYCEQCLDGREPTESHGDPLEKYSLPIGWVRFPVVMDKVNRMTSSETMDMSSSTQSLSNILTSWHVAYHGLPVAHVRRVLDAGQVYATKKNHWGYIPPPKPSPADAKDVTTDVPPIVFSPIIEYGGLPVFSTPMEKVSDEEFGDDLVVRTALQLLVKPGSYKKDPAAHSPFIEPFPQGFDVDALHWSTKEQGSLHVTALLIRVDAGESD